MQAALADAGECARARARNEITASIFIKFTWCSDHLHGTISRLIRANYAQSLGRMGARSHNKHTLGTVNHCLFLARQVARCLHSIRLGGRVAGVSHFGEL